MTKEMTFLQVNMRATKI